MVSEPERQKNDRKLTIEVSGRKSRFGGHGECGLDMLPLR